jgi:hypothetical protein
MLKQVLEMTFLRVDSHMTRHDKIFVCVYDMLEFTVVIQRQLTTKTVPSGLKESDVFPFVHVVAC